MAERDDAIEHVEFLARSRTRISILETLLNRGEVSRDDLRAELDVASSTAGRALRSLVDRGWVDNEGQTYRLSPVGEVVASEFLSLTETVRAVDDLTPFLRWFPHHEYDLAVSDLRDADVTVAREGDPYAPARRHRDTLRTAREFRALLPSIDVEGIRATDDRLRNGELTAEMIGGRAVADTVASEEYAPLLREQVETGNLTLRTLDTEPPFFLGLTGDGLVQIGVEDDDGFPQALVETDSVAVREWAAELYREHRERSVELSSGDLI